MRWYTALYSCGRGRTGSRDSRGDARSGSQLERRWHHQRLWPLPAAGRRPRVAASMRRITEGITCMTPTGTRDPRQSSKISSQRTTRCGGAAPPDDVISGLLQTEVNGAPLSGDDITSILHNWTVGELGSLAAGVGILARHLAVDGTLQSQLREEPGLLPAAIDEILRISEPSGPASDLSGEWVEFAAQTWMPAPYRRFRPGSRSRLTSNES